MIELLPGFIEIAFLVFCLIDCIQSPESQIRNLPKWAWIVLIIIIPLVGGIAWLAVGRPLRQATGQWQPGSGFPEAERPVTNTQDIDDRLNADLARVDREHEEMLKRWQDDLERREREAGSGDDSDRPH